MLAGRLSSRNSATKECALKRLIASLFGPLKAVHLNAFFVKNDVMDPAFSLYTG
jgi:hypothetical protein